MIQSFRCKETEKIFNREWSRKLPHDIHKVALRKLAMVNAAHELHDLKVPPANQLEALRDDRKGQHSIRINKQWRVCFKWHAGNAHEVEIVDYH
jgi:proteic killer suppression protein